MFVKVKGLVLRETEYKDHDKILTILSDSMGLLTARAWGVKRKSSPLKSGCQLLACAEFTLDERNGFQKVHEAVPLELFPALRTDIELLSLASYFAQTAEVLAQQDMPDPDLLPLILSALKALTQKKPQMLVKAAYELRLAAIAGYEPDLSACSQCGKDEAEYFNVSLGQLECASCARNNMGYLRMPLSAGCLDAMKYALYCSVEKLFSFSLGEASLKAFSQICETYFLTRLERGFSTLDFYKSLMLT